jgi:hypothetical protein
MEKINSYYSSLQQPTPDPISLVVSLGDGILQPQQLGVADSTAAYYLSLSGQQTRVSNPKELLQAFQNVVALYSSAAVSDLVCVQQCSRSYSTEFCDSSIDPCRRGLGHGQLFWPLSQIDVHHIVFRGSPIIVTDI